MTVCLLAILCLAALGAAQGAEVYEDAQPPIEAELLARVTARSVRAGDTVFARVAMDWKGDGCVLRQGATLEGTVVEVQPRLSREKHSELALTFKRAECGGAAMKPFALRLEVVAAPLNFMTDDSSWTLPMEADDGSAALLPASHLPASHLPGSHLVGVPARSGRSIGGRLEWHSGQVVGIRGLRLSVGTGPDSSSVLSRYDTDVELEVRTRLLLLPEERHGEYGEVAQLTAPKMSGGALNPAAMLTEAPAVTMLADADDAEDENGCGPGECVPAAGGDEPAREEPVADQSIAQGAAGDEHYGGIIPLRDAGFVPRVNMELLAPSDDDALAWLGPSELLVAFNPHQLVPRHGMRTANCTVRMIRAVLVDVKTHKMRRTVDWALPDTNEYLWALPGNRALVHVGSELRVYGAGLRMERRIALRGPLAFLRVSPDGKTIAVGVVRERHTPELHARLASILGKEPEEDVEVLILDGGFSVIASAISSSERIPPVLLNEGQVRLIVPAGQEGKKTKRFGLQLRTWDNATRMLARFGSTCVPDVSTLAPDLVFLVTCDNLNGARNYRVLRTDGNVVVNGHSLLRELGHAASGSGAANTFAVRIFKAETPLLPGEPFHAADLRSAELMVYRSQDGKRLFSVRVKDPAASSGGYALSPQGGVAVLAQDGVDVYALPR